MKLIACICLVLINTSALANTYGDLVGTSSTGTKFTIAMDSGTAVNREGHPWILDNPTLELRKPSRKDEYVDSRCRVNFLIMECQSNSPLGRATYKGYTKEQRNGPIIRRLKCVKGCGKDIPATFNYHDYSYYDSP